MSFNYAEFNRAIQGFSREVEERTNDLTRRAAFRVYREIRNKTAVGNPSIWNGPAPDGYVGGRLRASLTIKAESPDLTVATIGDTSTPDPSLGRLRRDPTIYISNNLPYATPVLMNAWSAQTPENMAEDAVLKEYRRLESGRGI